MAMQEQRGLTVQQHERQVATQQGQNGGVLATWGFGDEERELIKRQIAPGATDGELNVFLAFASRCKLDPFQKPPLLWAYKRNPKNPDEKLTIDVSIDGLRLIASRFDAYEGQTAPQYCGADGNWRDVWTAEDPPVACRIGVYRRGFREPQWGIAYWDESAQRTSSGDLYPIWKKHPLQMLATAAERRAIKKGFQHDIQQVLGHQVRVEINDDERMQEMAERTRQWVQDEKRNNALERPPQMNTSNFRVVDQDGVIEEPSPLGNVDMDETPDGPALDADGQPIETAEMFPPDEPEQDPRQAIIEEQVGKWVRTWQRKVLQEPDKKRFWAALQKAIQEGTAEAEVLEMVKAQVLPQ